jgi:hypothetical protein
MRMRRFITLGLVLTTAVTALAADPAQKDTVPIKADKSAKTKADELPKSGVNIARQKGDWLNVEASGARFVVKFFDAEKKPVAPDVERATARFRYAAKSDVNRGVLNREGEALVSPGNVRPPHNFLVTLTLLRGEAESAAATEVYNFKYP